MLAFQIALLVPDNISVESAESLNLFASMLTWINLNSGFVMVLTTIVYTVFTLFLVIQNRNATEETRRQFYETNRGRVFPNLVKVADEGGELLCLKFENPTNTPVEKVKLRINQEWLSQYDKLHSLDAKKTKYNLEVINSAPFFMVMPKQAFFYKLCSIPGDEYNKLSNCILEITIDYVASAASTEVFSFNLEAIGTQLSQPSDYVRLERRHLQKLDNIYRAIKK